MADTGSSSLTGVQIFSRVQSVHNSFVKEQSLHIFYIIEFKDTLNVTYLYIVSISRYEYGYVDSICSLVQSYQERSERHMSSYSLDVDSTYR